MRRNLMLGLLFTAAALLFVIPLFPPAAQAPSEAMPPSKTPVAHGKLTAKAETSHKEADIRRDMIATSALSKGQIANDLRRFLRNNPRRSPDALSELLKIHPEIRRAEWRVGGQLIPAGDIPNALQTAAESHLDSARAALGSNKIYFSPIFKLDGKSYFVAALGSGSQAEAPSGNPRGLADGSPAAGIVALVAAETVEAVERHQRRNMRLVPYPAEGRYRTESVLPGSNRDTTVRTGEDNGNASHYSVDEIVVKFRQPITDRQLLQLRGDLGLTVVRSWKGTYVFRSRKHNMKELKQYFQARFKTSYIEPHYLYLTNARPAAHVENREAATDVDDTPIVPNDTLYSAYQWNLPDIATENGWNITKGSDEIVVAVLDTGVQIDHPDLVGRLVEGINIVDPALPPDDDVGHGTHVAGIIAAEVNNNEGVAGMTWFTKIMPVKVLDGTGAGSTYSVAEGIVWAVDHGADVINMSLGNYAEAEFLHDALRYAYERGVVLVAASGNDNTDRPGYPAAYPEVLAVAAIDPDERRADYSNYGDYIDVTAPGTSIPSTYPGSQYASLSGTSMASPHVAALASLVRAVNPQLSADEVMELLRATSKDLGTEGKDADFGNGLIDVNAAVRAADGLLHSLQLFPTRVRSEIVRSGGVDSAF